MVKLFFFTALISMIWIQFPSMALSANSDGIPAVHEASLRKQVSDLFNPSIEKEMELFGDKVRANLNLECKPWSITRIVCQISDLTLYGQHANYNAIFKNCLFNNCGRFSFFIDRYEEQKYDQFGNNSECWVWFYLHVSTSVGLRSPDYSGVSYKVDIYNKSTGRFVKTIELPVIHLIGFPGYRNGGSCK